MQLKAYLRQLEGQLSADELATHGRARTQPGLGGISPSSAIEIRD